MGQGALYWLTLTLVALGAATAPVLLAPLVTPCAQGRCTAARRGHRHRCAAQWINFVLAGALAGGCAVVLLAKGSISPGGPWPWPSR